MRPRVIGAHFHSRPSSPTDSSVNINPQRRLARLLSMNNAIAETPAQRPRGSGSREEITQLKKELLQAEVRLARARATVAGAEVDLKVLYARLKSFS